VNRRETLAAFAVLGGGGSRAARAQPTARIARIGLLSLDSAGDSSGRDDFARGLSELGYFDGRNIVLERRDAQAGSNASPASPRNSSLSRST
jgi:hypothetical protein